MAKILQGKVVSNKMTGTIIVEVERLIPHPLFKKLLRRGRKFKVATNGQKVEIGAIVKIIGTRPVAKDKYFALHSSEMTSDVVTPANPVVTPANPVVTPANPVVIPAKAGIQLHQSKKTKASTKKKGNK